MRRDKDIQERLSEAIVGPAFQDNTITSSVLAEWLIHDRIDALTKIQEQELEIKKLRHLLTNTP